MSRDCQKLQISILPELIHDIPMPRLYMAMHQGYRRHSFTLGVTKY